MPCSRLRSLRPTPHERPPCYTRSGATTGLRGLQVTADYLTGLVHLRKNACTPRFLVIRVEIVLFGGRRAPKGGCASAVL